MINFIIIQIFKLNYHYKFARFIIYKVIIWLKLYNHSLFELELDYVSLLDLKSISPLLGIGQGPFPTLHRAFNTPVQSIFMHVLFIIFNFLIFNNLKLFEHNNRLIFNW